MDSSRNGESAAALAVPNVPVGAEKTSGNSFRTDELFHSLDEESVVLIMAQGEYQWQLPSSALDPRNGINAKSNIFCVGRDSRHKWYFALRKHYTRAASADGFMVELATHRNVVSYNSSFASRGLDLTVNLERCPVQEVTVDYQVFLNGDLLVGDKTVVSPTKPILHCFPESKLIGNGRPLDRNVFTLKLEFASEASKLNLHRGGEKLASDFHSMLSCGNFTDLTITCKDGSRILAHRSVLSARCPVFTVLFSHSVFDSQLNAIAMTYYNTGVVQAFLTFLYTGHIHSFDKVADADELLRIAEEYKVAEMIGKCAVRLAELLSPSTAIDVLLVAHTHSLMLLKEDAMQCIAANQSYFTNVNAYDALLKCEPCLLAEILANNGKL